MPDQSDLPEQQRAAIQNALNETFAAEVHVRFETAPDVVGGIELTVNGHKVGWSISDYLTSLENGLGELLKEKDKPEAKAGTKPKPKVERRAAAKPVAKTASGSKKPRPERIADEH